MVIQAFTMTAIAVHAWTMGFLLLDTELKMEWITGSLKTGLLKH